MALRRLTHERYDRMKTDGKWDAHLDSLGVDRSPIAPVPEPPRMNDDLPAIKETRPTWWQVRRIERAPEGRRAVLIYESPDETAALKVAMAQRYLCRVTKWGDKRQPFETFKDPKVIA